MALSKSYDSLNNGAPSSYWRIDNREDRRGEGTIRYTVSGYKDATVAGTTGMNPIDNKVYIYKVPTDKIPADITYADLYAEAKKQNGFVGSTDA